MRLPQIKTRGDWFVDEHGRTVILRGVNLGGDCKVPSPDGGTDHPGSLDGDRSFVGRPFPLDEAAEHLGRIAHWGFGVLRLLVTWEAVEHAGPGVYDEAFLDYFAEVCRLAGEHGLYVFVDFHQDVWSRWTGGDGAPRWTLEALGMDPARIDATDAAIVMQHRYDYADERKEQPDRYPRMCWSQNYAHPANAVAWSMFWAGKRLRPGWTIDGRNIQDVLQGHYLGAMRAVAERVAHLPHVIGFDTLNEPSAGWIGVAMSDRRDQDAGGRRALPGIAWSPLEGLHAMAGNRVVLPRLAPSILRGRCVPVEQATVNPQGERLWRGEDPFADLVEERDGVPVAVDEEAFRGDLEFERDCFVPFVHRVAETVRAVREDWLIFFEKDAVEAVFDPSLEGGLPEGCVNATHWYDIITLERKRFLHPFSFDVVHMRPAIGTSGIRAMYVRQLARIRDASRKLPVPTLIGEFGIPYDLRGGAAYRAWDKGDRSARPWREHILALTLMYDAMDDLLLSSTQWNYTASNRNDLRVGDGWNQEDLSIFSRDQRVEAEDADSGGRAYDGFSRPYARFVQGTPESVLYRDGVFRLVFAADPSIDAPTEIYVPRRRFPGGIRVSADTARVDEKGQWLHVWAEIPGRLEIVVAPEV